MFDDQHLMLGRVLGSSMPTPWHWRRARYNKSSRMLLALRCARPSSRISLMVAAGSPAAAVNTGRALKAAEACGLDRSQKRRHGR